MTSQGHPQARFERALKTNNVELIIGAALELPRPILIRDGLRVLLAIRDHAPERYPIAAVRFAASLSTRHRLTVVDAQLALAALNALAGPSPGVGAEALEALLEAHGEHQAAGCLGEWVRVRGG